MKSNEPGGKKLKGEISLSRRSTQSYGEYSVLNKSLS